MPGLCCYYVHRDFLFIIAKTCTIYSLKTWHSIISSPAVFCHCSPVFDDKESFDDFSCLNITTRSG